MPQCINVIQRARTTNVLALHQGTSAQHWDESFGFSNGNDMIGSKFDVDLDENLLVDNNPPKYDDLNQKTG